jgi:hypothetical protein
VRMFKWLGSFSDPDEAELFMLSQAKKLKGLGLTNEYRVDISSDATGHHVQLWKRSDVDLRKKH